MNIKNRFYNRLIKIKQPTVALFRTTLLTAVVLFSIWSLPVSADEFPNQVLMITDAPEVLGKLPPETLLFRLNNLLNEEENFVSIQETMRILSKEISVPIFTAWDFDIGLGAIGGVLDNGVAFIQKPFSMTEMMEKLREVLDMAPQKV